MFRTLVVKPKMYRNRVIKIRFLSLSTLFPRNYNSESKIFFVFFFSSDLDDLSVKQLKEILMLNRVDFKGCCEKTELLERVKRLWNELHSVPGKHL